MLLAWYVYTSVLLLPSCFCRYGIYRKDTYVYLPWCDIMISFMILDQNCIYHTPASTKLKGEYTGFTLSICPSVLLSVCPSVDRIDPLCIFNNTCQIHFILHILSSNFRRCVVCKNLKNMKFRPILQICNFDIVLFWLGIQYDSIVWVIMRQRGVSWECRHSSWIDLRINVFTQNNYYTPCFNQVERRYTGFTLSVRLSIHLSTCQSVCLSVDRIVSALYLQQYFLDPFHVCTCLACNILCKIAKFWLEIWHESIAWVNMGWKVVFSKCRHSSCSSIFEFNLSAFLIRKKYLIDIYF